MASTLSKHSFLRWSIVQNGNVLVRYHNFLKCTLDEKIVEIERMIEDESDNKKEINLRSLRHEVSNCFKSQLVSTCLLELMAHIEESLFNIHQSMAKSIKIKRSTGLERYKEVISFVSGINIGLISEWSVLLEAERIRHCLIHCCGRIHLFKRSNMRKKLLVFINQHPDLLSIELDRLLLKHELLKFFIDNWNFLLNKLLPDA